MPRVLASLVLLVPLAASAAKAPPEFDPAADPAALAATFVKADKLKALGSVKRAAIAQFRVEFAVENDAKASSSGSAGWTSVDADIKLVGVTDEARQAIADRLYDRLVQDLTAAGLEVVPHETLSANADYASLGPVLRTAQEPLGTQTGKSIFVGGRGAPYYMTNDDKHLGLGTMLGGFSTTQPQNIEPRIAKSLDAAVFRVTLFVAFASQGTSGGMFRSQSGVDTAARLSFVAPISQMLVVTPEGRTRVQLDQNVLLGGDVLQMKETTTQGEKTAQAVANVVTGLLAGGTRKVAHYEASTTPEAYSEAVARYGQAVASAMVSALRPGLPVPAAVPPSAPAP